MNPSRRIPAVFLATLAVAALPSPASASAAGLLDGLLGTVVPSVPAVGQTATAVPIPPLSGVPNLTQLPSTPTELAGLTTLLDSLAGGTAPSMATLAPVSALLTQVSAQLPADQKATVDALVAELAAGGAPSAAELTAVGTLLQSIAMTPGVPAPLMAVLNPIAATLGGGGGLTGLPSTPNDLAGLTGLLATLGALPADGVPSPTDLAPLTALLGQISAQLPPEQKVAVDALIAELGKGGAPTAAVLAPVGTLLRSIATAPGVPAPLSSVLNRLADELVPGSRPSTGTTGGAVLTPVPKRPTAGVGVVPGAARKASGPKVSIESVGVDRRRTRLRVVVSCPAGPVPCVTALYALRGSKLLAPTQTFTIPAGSKAVRSLKLSSATRKALRKRGFRAIVGAVGSGGAVQRSMSVKRIAKVKK